MRGFVDANLTISGSRSAKVTDSTFGYFRTSRRASPSPPPKISTLRAFGFRAITG